MNVPLWVIMADIVLWLIVVSLQALRLSPTAISHFELNRRVRSGDPEAQMIDEREQFLSRLRTLRDVIQTIVWVLAVVLTVSSLGWVIGGTTAVVVTLFITALSRSELLGRIAERVYAPYEQFLLRLIKSWRWLDWLRGYSVSKIDSVIASKEELVRLLQQSPGVLTHDESMRFYANLALDDRTVADIMTPISVVDTADVHDTLGPLVLDDLHKTGHSRFPVIDGDVHHVVGVLYLHDLVDLNRNKKTVADAMDSRVHYIHEAQSLTHALHGFLRTHRHLFVVVNDYRETVGVLTLEDVVEELLGQKIVDEFDKYDDLRAVAESNPRKNNMPKRRTDI